MSRSWKCGWLDGVVQLPSGVVQLSRRLGPLGVTDTKHCAAVVEPGAFRTGLFNPARPIPPPPCPNTRPPPG
jgi:hypothetical protein